MNEGVITLCAVGDILLARKDYELAFIRVASILKEADISFFNCEAPHAQSGSPAGQAHGAVDHDPMVLPAFVAAGFDVCTLANNHAMDWGVEALVECRGRLQALGIEVCGAGLNRSEARRPAMLERNGVRVAFLGYCSTGPQGANLGGWAGGVAATDDTPGCAVLRVHTAYEPLDYYPGTPRVTIVTWPNREDLQRMREDISNAKKEADIVVMTDHWGTVYDPVVIPDYELDIGHAAIDAGADLVLGHSPHILKGIEVYKGKVIVHSLGNFSLDRADHEERSIDAKSWNEFRRPQINIDNQRKSFIFKCLISQGTVRRASYVPIMLDEHLANPEPLASDDPRAADIFRFVAESSSAVGFDTKFAWEKDEVVIVR
jgi:poly-gamma-glutamate capsule biosynthesis protein CapA/YwtB (metallophosphatase superfamily)